jgi:predicted RNA-binding Zn-ribbon protein involved in translation (DUF1610 family)
MTTCPSCGSTRVFRSKTRNAVERWRRQFTTKRPYRCHACNWRGWAPDGLQDVALSDALDSATPPPDLNAIAAAMTERGGKRVGAADQKPEARTRKQVVRKK